MERNVQKKAFVSYIIAFQLIAFILFSKTGGFKEINISFEGHSIKQHKTVECLGCQLDSKLSREAMASKVLKKNKC